MAKERGEGKRGEISGSGCYAKAEMKCVACVFEFVDAPLRVMSRKC